MKLTMQQTEPTHIATISTIFFSLIGIQDISSYSNVIFLVASTISCTISILVGIKQLKNKK
jgi:hypothetical protein